jgi:hypothetical protein
VASEKSMAKIISDAKIVSDTERMKNTPILACAKTAFVG